MFNRKERKGEPKIKQLIGEAIIVRQGAVSNLNQAVDHELVDAAIYELNAADLRLNYLLREYRVNLN